MIARDRSATEPTISCQLVGQHSEFTTMQLARVVRARVHVRVSFATGALAATRRPDVEHGLKRSRLTLYVTDVFVHPRRLAVTRDCRMPVSSHDQRAHEANARFEQEQHQQVVNDKLENKGVMRKDRHPGACCTRWSSTASIDKSTFRRHRWLPQPDHHHELTHCAYC